MTLKKEQILILANIPMTFRGGNHVHAGIIMDPARYLLTAGVPLNNPANPVNYPANVTGNAAAGVRAQAKVEHKEEVKVYETFQGVVQGCELCNQNMNSMFKSATSFNQNRCQWGLVPTFPWLVTVDILPAWDAPSQLVLFRTFRIQMGALYCTSE